MSQDTTVDEKVLAIEIEYLSELNLALHQNALPVIFTLRLRNGTEQDLRKVVCRMTTTPGMMRENRIVIEAIPAGEEVVLRNPAVELDYDFLMSLSDRVSGTLHVEVLSTAGECLAAREQKMEAFAAGQWVGLKGFPEMLASFVTPNLEVITLLMREMARELEQRTGNPSLDGYQSGSKERVYEMCAAAYRAVCGWGLTYANPVSSFGVPGQRIRFADALYKHRLATCLDTTLLFASVMEQCGLHPVILLQEGHAYLGCHLKEYYFPDVPMEELQVIRKLADLDEFVVIETTMVTQGATFAEAEAAARKNHLNIGERFRCAVDVVRARYSGIRPLPLKRSTDGIEFELPLPPGTATEPKAEQRRDLCQDIELSKTGAETSAKGRIARWQQKLLDLSLRNRLLNVRDTRLVVPIACTDIATLEDKIALNEVVALNGLNDLLSESDLHNLAMQRTIVVKDQLRDLLEGELAKRRLWSPLPPPDLRRRLTEIYRQSRTDIEEGGVNTLFLALGFLEWKKEGRSLLAPILLIPVRLTRQSVQSGFSMVRLDEDTVVNVTLLEMLRREFEVSVLGLDPLPLDDAGVDVSRVMQIFRQTFKVMSGWEVREEARLGVFSFSKFIMWNDLTNRIDALRKNPIITHLIDGGGAFDDGIEVFDPASLEHSLDVRNLFCPLSADASQLTAVLYSALGKCFVLHGPPGTGKSQTIANLIAHNLALGRRVLFVSEKRAALDVVYKRLSAIGLGPFCLELHSNKTAKGDVLKQFAEALAVADTAPSAAWDTVTAQWLALRNELNGYAVSLHTAYPNGLTAYHCLSRLIKDTNIPTADVSNIDFLNQTRDDFSALNACAASLAEAFANVSADTRKAFVFIRLIEWRPALQDTLVAETQRVLASVEPMRNTLAEQTERFGLPVCAATREQVSRMVALCETARVAEPDFPPTLLSHDLPAVAESLREGIANGRTRDLIAAQLASFHADRVLDLDCASIAKRLDEFADRFILVRFFLGRALLKELKGLKKIGAPALTLRELTEKLPLCRQYIETRRRSEEQRAGLQARFGTLWSDTTNWDKLDAALTHAENVHAALSACCGVDAALPDTAFTQLSDPAVRNTTGPFTQQAAAFENVLQAFDASYGLPATDDLDCLAQSLRTLLSQMRDIRRALIWKQLCAEACAAGLANWVVALECDLIPPENITLCFELSVCNAMTHQILAADKTLRDFMGNKHDVCVKNFREWDTRYMRLSQNIIISRLTAALPRARRGTCPEGTELGFLKRECEKRARQKPPRELLAKIPALLPTLKPCFLMSPLSVAQYLPPEMATFDLLVFDEASQIPVWDAIGAIARASQLIVVGDPKQMPPTNFFQRGDSDDTEPEPDSVEDLESILDECLAAGLHSSYLNWHYRSRHESLIAFSNHHYYNDRLHTFPAASDAPHLGVSFQFVPDAVYDRTQTRTNAKEAAAIVAYLIERLTDPATREKSIGVVTFSQSQKNLIEDLLEQAIVRCPHLEPYLDKKGDEPLFVKNLENVQGDERDVILFSVGYAPDKEGRFYMNFGPLNRQGGERRLNVAITRAKEQVIVFASIRAHQIDPARTVATGALHLKHFLDYAERGGRQMAFTTPAVASLDPFPAAVAEFLTAHHYRVQPYVGHSACRIDLAVLHPDKPGHYLMGIECDGTGYTANPSVRDRDRLRHDILGTLGWNMCRLWAADWYHDRARAEQTLLDILASVRAGVLPPSPVPEHTPEPPPSLVEEMPAAPFNAPPYVKWEAPCKHPQSAFYLPEMLPVIRDQLLAVIRTEAPVCESLLRRRVTGHWGFSRAGAKIQTILTDALPPAATTTLTRSGENVYWSDTCRPDTLTTYRVPAGPGTRREIGEIPPEEIAQAMLAVITYFHSCRQDVLFRETIRLLGFSILTDTMRADLEHAFDLLKHRGTLGHVDTKG
ncbi:MAG: DUF3320 domain-containing protein [Kiritimatiellaeota bacterium]|nr:DUF3320 domain-containing protein [Kiritimatiellota bacterium]